MATNTPNLDLRKPDVADDVNVTTDISENMDKIDAGYGDVLAAAQVFVPPFDSSPVVLSQILDKRIAAGSSEGGICLSADGTLVYVACNTAGAVMVVNIADRSFPYIVGYLAHANLASASGIAVLDTSHVVVACDVANRFTVVDVSNPASPTIAGTTTTGLVGVDVAVQGVYAFVASRTGNALVIINCTTPTAPVQIGRLQDATNLSAARSVKVFGNYAYLTAQSGNRLTIVDITIKSAPVLAGTIQDATNLSGAYGLALASDGNHAYVAALTGNKLTVVDTTTKGSPTVAGTVTLSSSPSPKAVVLIGSTAMVGTGDGSVIRVNITTPASPTQIDTLLGGHQYHDPGRKFAAAIERMAVSSDVLVLGAVSTRVLTVLGPHTIMPTKAGASVAIVGDSITNRNGAGTDDHANRGYFTWANALLGHALSLVWNGGIDSDTTTGVLARTYRSAIIARPTYVVLAIGTNDFIVGSSAIDLAIANYRRIVAAFTNAGIEVICCSMIPRIAAQFTGGAPLIKEFYAFNDWIRNYATVTPGTHLCDWYAVMADDVTGEPITSPAVTVDGTHPNPEGARRMGSVLASVFTAIGVAGSPRRGMGNGDTNNLLTNGQLSGNSSGVATSWTVTGSATPTKVARTDLDGDWQQLASISGTVTLTPAAAPSVPATGSDGAIGGTVVGYVELDIDAGASFTQMSLRINTNNSADTYDMYPAEATAVLPSGRVTLQTAPLVVPQSSTTFTFEVKFIGTGTVRVGSARLFAVDRF